MRFSCPAHKPLLQLLHLRLRRQLGLHQGCAKMSSLTISSPEGRYTLAVSDTERIPEPEINPITRPLLNDLLLTHSPTMQSSSQLMGKAVSISGAVEVLSSVTSSR